MPLEPIPLTRVSSSSFLMGSSANLQTVSFSWFLEEPFLTTREQNRPNSFLQIKDLA
jgi:hypothetical protein